MPKELGAIGKLNNAWEAIRKKELEGTFQLQATPKAKGYLEIYKKQNPGKDYLQFMEFLLNQPSEENNSPPTPPLLEDIYNINPVIEEQNRNTRKQQLRERTV